MVIFPGSPVRLRREGDQALGPDASPVHQLWSGAGQVEGGQGGPRAHVSGLWSGDTRGQHPASGDSGGQHPRTVSAL